MKILFFNIIAIAMVSMCHAQTVLTLSRNEAIQLGLKNRFDIKAKQFDVHIAASKIKQARNQWVTELSADGQVKYSPQLQNAVIPGGVIPGFDKTTQVPLMVRNESVFGLNLSQPIFNAAMTNDTKLAKNQLALQQEKNRAAEIDIMLQISRSYLDTELRRLQKRIAADIVERNREYEHIAEGMYNNGSLIENYYLRAKLDRENAEQLQQQADQDFELSLMQLHYQLNISNDIQLILSDSLNVPVAGLSIYDKPNGERSEIRQLELIQEDNHLNLKKIQESVLPSVNFGANYSQQFLSNNFNYGTGNWWSPFSYLALNIHVPISIRLKNKDVVTEYRQRITQNQLLLAQKKADINYEVQQSQTALRNAVLNINSAKKSYELSKTILQNQQEQYRLGAFDYSTLLDTEKSLSTTERNYIQSAYELMLAQIQLQKATNNFNTNQ